MTRILPLFVGLLSVFLIGCGSDEVLFEKGKPGTLMGSTKLAPGEAHLVHIDTVERIATIRNGAAMDGFLIVTNPTGNQSAILKALPLGEGSSLRSADILEGQPLISDRVRVATEAEASELAEIYRDADTETE